MPKYQHTPIQDITAHPLLRKAGVRLLLKREDLNHPTISGNKWWKLKYNIAEAVSAGHNTVLTFGGAYSNHIYATAAAAKAAGLRSIGIIRGEETLPLNPTLTFATSAGMILDYVDRQAYRRKEAPEFVDDLQRRWGRAYVIPEGGTNELAVKGCEEFGRIIDAVSTDYICLPVGTGGTIAGIIRGVSPSKKVVGISVLKDGHFLEDAIKEHLRSHSSEDGSLVHWELMTEYSYGGYGRRNQTVTDVLRSISAELNIDLDFVYTGKMMSAVIDLIAKGYFQRGQTVMAIHTGGLQGHS